MSSFTNSVMFFTTTNVLLQHFTWSFSDKINFKVGFQSFFCKIKGSWLHVKPDFVPLCLNLTTSCSKNDKQRWVESLLCFWCLYSVGFSSFHLSLLCFIFRLPLSPFAVSQINTDPSGLLIVEVSMAYLSYLRVAQSGGDQRVSPRPSACCCCCRRHRWQRLRTVSRVLFVQQHTVRALLSLT